MNSLNSRNISEHLCTLATLLEAEALRARALGAANAKQLSRQAIEVRCMSDDLWDADITLPLAANAGQPAGPACTPGAPASPEAANSLQALGLVKNVVALVI
jgi:hypothetical protein